MGLVGTIVNDFITGPNASAPAPPQIVENSGTPLWQFAVVIVAVVLVVGGIFLVMKLLKK